MMLVSVTERIHEIGLRKAIGATNKQILRQFITEAFALCFVGALAAVVVVEVAELTTECLSGGGLVYTPYVPTIRLVRQNPFQFCVMVKSHAQIIQRLGRRRAKHSA